MEDYYDKLNKSDREMHVLYDIPYMYNPPPKYNKLVNIIKIEQTHRYREQIRSYQWGEADSQIQREQTRRHQKGNRGVGD